MSQPYDASPFTDAASVEAWDAWFRWRERGVLRDTAIEDTWQRVATALAAVEEPGRRAWWHRRLMRALATWRLLPDERILATAGTRAPDWYAAPLHAVLNAAVFVQYPGTARAAIAHRELAECARLAVRVLDNAALAAGIPQPRVRIGVIGIADALALLTARYDSAAGCAEAASIARTVAVACLGCSVHLARLRGARRPGTDPRLAPALRADAFRSLRRAAARAGLRFDGVTAITSQPRLALLANDVADAVDPLRGAGHVHAIASPAGPRTIRSSGYALNRLRTPAGGAGPAPDTLPDLPLSAQVRMRAALQPWLDRPIDYPVPVPHAFDHHQRLAFQRELARHRVTNAGWRLLGDDRAGTVHVPER